MLLVLYAGLCKALLFRDLEYYGSDFFSFLEMTWSWSYGRGVLHDNVYGHHSAIHNFYLLPAFSLLTVPLGAYGLILGLVLLHLAATLRLARASALSLAGRLAVLAGLLSPVAWYVFDHPEWGFHPELGYPPLVLLFALDLLEGGRPRRAVLLGAAIVLVKEDGAVLCAGVLVAWFATRLPALRRASRAERRRAVARAALILLAVTLAFAAGLAVLTATSRAVGSGEGTAARRIPESLTMLANTLAGRGRPDRPRALQEGLVGYALMGALLLLPLGRRLPRGLLLLLLSAPPLVTVLMVSSSTYRFTYMLWPPRLATLLALVLACLAFAPSAEAGPASPRRLAGVIALGTVSWGLQLLLLARVGYAPGPRLHAPALLEGRGYRVSTLPPGELRFLRCVAGRLPRGLAVSAFGDTHPLFHRQSIVFEGFRAPTAPRPRLRVVPAADPPPEDGASCPGPRVGGVALVADCALLPLVAGCEREGTPGAAGGQAFSAR